MLERERSEPMKGDADGTFVQFFLGAEKNEVKSLAAGHAIHDEHEFVEISFAGNQQTKHVKRVDDATRERFAPAYNKWKSGISSTQEGTPLGELKFLNAAVIADMKFMNIHTVEALAALSDTGVQAFGMGAQEWKNKAAKWLADTRDGAAAKKLAAENETLRGDLEAVKKQLADLSKQLEEANRKKAA